MNKSTPQPAPQLLFYTLDQLQAAGGPGRSKAYELADHGLLNIVKSPAGRVGVTADEARRFFAASQPIGQVKRNLAKATAASVRSRAGRAS
jgi:hypothetical protein